MWWIFKWVCSISRDATVVTDTDDSLRLFVKGIAKVGQWFIVPGPYSHLNQQGVVMRKSSVSCEEGTIMWLFKEVGLASMCLKVALTVRLCFKE